MAFGERTNSERARRVCRALVAQDYTEGLGLAGIKANPGLARQAVKDLLCDVRHFCDRVGVDYADADQAGYRSYQTECWEDPAGDWPPSAVPRSAAIMADSAAEQGR